VNPVLCKAARLHRFLAAEHLFGYCCRVKNVTVKCPEDVHRRFAAWCKLNGRTIQEVLIAFMRDKGEALARFEDRKSSR
jgi:hypothetical protein